MSEQTSFDKGVTAMVQKDEKDNDSHGEHYKKIFCGHKLLDRKETLKLILRAQKDLPKELILLKTLDDLEKEGAKENDEAKKEIIEKKIKKVLAGLSSSSPSMDKLIIHNQRLVFDIAGKIFRCFPKKIKAMVDIWDLVQYGNFGLRRAVLKFDPSKECMLSTYAAIWIRQAIQRTLLNQNFRAVRVAVHAHQLNGLCQKFLTKAMSADVLPDRPLRFFGGMTLWQIKERTVFCDNVVSLDKKIQGHGSNDNGEGLAYEDVIADTRVKLPDDGIEMLEAQDILERLLPAARLSDKEKKIIFERFGIGKDKGETRTLEEVGKDFGLSRERIRQIEKGILEKLRRAYQRVFKQTIAPCEKERGKAPATAVEKKQKSSLGRTDLLRRLQSMKVVEGEMFLKVLEMTPEEAESIIDECKKRAKLKKYSRRSFKKFIKKPAEAIMPKQRKKAGKNPKKS